MKDFASFNAIAFICNYFISRLSDIYKLVHTTYFRDKEVDCLKN